jgi:hypothetical protein
MATNTITVSGRTMTVEAYEQYGLHLDVSYFTSVKWSKREAELDKRNKKARVG